VLFGCLLLEFPFIVVEAVSVSLIDIEVVVSMIALLVALMILVEVVVLVFDTASTTIKGNSNNRQPNNTIVLHTVLALWTFWTCPDWMSDKS
jgi:hypothetical protein